ncbi:hypothetical protein [Streptomyces peucetius]
MKPEFAVPGVLPVAAAVVVTRAPAPEKTPARATPRVHPGSGA